MSGGTDLNRGHHEPASCARRRRVRHRRPALRHGTAIPGGASYRGRRSGPRGGARFLQPDARSAVAGMSAAALSHFGETFAVDDFQAAWIRHFWVIAETRLTLKTGVLELLDTLDQLRLPRAIATSSSRQTVERHLIASNLTGRFDAIVGRGDYK